MGCLPELKPILAYRAVCLVVFFLNRSGDQVFPWPTTYFSGISASAILKMLHESFLKALRCGVEGEHLLSFGQNFIRVINAMDRYTDRQQVIGTLRR